MDLRPYLDELEQFADGQLSTAAQEVFERRLEQDSGLAAAYEAYEQLTADLRWAAGHQALRERLLALDEHLDQRQSALLRLQRGASQRQRRWLVRGGVAVAVLLALGSWLWRRQTTAQVPTNWEAYYQPEPGVVPTAALAQQRPLLYEAMLQYRAGHYPATLHTLARISPTKTDSDTLSYLRGVVLLRQGRGLAAQPYLRRVNELGRAPIERRARYHLGMAYWQAGQLREARALLHLVAADSLNEYRAIAHRAEAAGVLASR